MAAGGGRPLDLQGRLLSSLSPRILRALRNLQALQAPSQAQRLVDKMGGLNEDQEDAVMSLALLQASLAFPRDTDRKLRSSARVGQTCLANKIKRDPEAYREEFLLQLSNFRGLLVALKEQPYRPTRKLQSLAMFLAHTAPCYSAEAADSWASGDAETLGNSERALVSDAFGPEATSSIQGPLDGGPSPSVELKEAMQQLLSSAELHPTTRHALLNAVLLLRSKKMLSCEELLQQSLALLCLKDKFVRQRLMAFVVKDVAKVFGSTNSNQARGLLLNRLFALLKSGSSPVAARLALCCLFQVYRHLSLKPQTRNSDFAAKVVNAVVGATLAPDAKLASSGALFLLGEIQAAATQANYSVQAEEEEGSMCSLNGSAVSLELYIGSFLR
ncbi:protein SDA1-like related protein [Cyclospora cayetanensis]|uniref:Protein SDA1 n=1 Tax=Cyclospora cayetanensis TaxID=88456 RepID=A0A1D3CWE2_9EIME|nr:protein SDA1-like related protein [Cyclospora cayetanensis]